MLPIRIYLDQRDWIYLAQAYHGLERGHRYQSALHRLQSAVDEGRVELPLSSIHFLETAQDRNSQRRGRLATVMTRLSRCQTMAPLWIITRAKLRRQLARALGYILPAEDDLDVFGVGVHHAFGQPPGNPVLLVPAAFSDILATPPNWLTIAEQAKEAETMRTIQDRRETRAQGIEKWRATAKHFSRPVRNRSYAAEVWASNLDLINELLRESGVTVGAVTELGHERLTEILRAVPELDVKIALVAERNEHWDRAVDANDERDIDAVALAVPNCDVMVTERFWCDLVKRRGLTDRYETTMVRDLARIPEVLDAYASRKT